MNISRCADASHKLRREMAGDIVDEKCDRVCAHDRIDAPLSVQGQVFTRE
jgi:hypothetical protein